MSRRGYEGPPAALLFGGFELRLDSSELLRDGAPVKLQLRPARVLALLALRAGAVVSREEIRREVWGEEHVDFDLALNYGIRQIRRALDDSAEEPRFVETLPRVGYRFLAPVEVRRDEPQTLPVAQPAPPPAPAPAPSKRSWSDSRRLFVATLVLLLSLVVGLIALRSRGSESSWPFHHSNGADVPPVSEKAMRAYLRGQYHSARAESDQAMQAFREATTLAPRYAPAWAALGHELLEEEGPEREMAPLLEVAERQALDLDPRLPLAHLNRAERLFRFKYDWTGAEREIQKAIDLDPQQAEAHFQYARLLAARGRFDEALDQMEQARYLKPEQQLIRSRSPWFYYLARRYGEAIAQAQSLIDLAPGKTSETNPTQPELFWAFRTTTLATLAKGDRKAALVAARAEARWLGDTEPDSLEGYWQYKKARFAKLGAVRPWSLVLPAIELGERERALDLLFQQCRERSDSMMAYLRVDPLYDSLRSDPRFQELLRCANQADGPG
ncbi:MAG: winged helix-turn-helix domain-containing protein [Thermoanaerobaculia bacterium]